MSTPVSVQGALRLKGSMIFDDNLVGFPANPQPGTMVVKEQVLYAYIRVNGINSWFPVTRVPQRHGHVQAVASDTWIINHNLNSDDIWYQIQDTTGQLMVAYDVIALDADNLRLVFTEPVQGKVYLLASGLDGEPGIPGAGIPAGGLTGQILGKASAADFDTTWLDAAAPAVADYDIEDVLLMRFQGNQGDTVFAEEIGGYTITSGGAVPPHISTAQAAIGGSSLYLTGNGYVDIVPQNNQLDFKNRNWTVDTLLYADVQAPPYPSWMASLGSWSAGAYAMQYDHAGMDQRFSMHWNSAPPSDPTILSPATYAPNVWRHVRYVKTGNTLKQFIDKRLVAQVGFSGAVEMNFARGGALRLGQSVWDGANGFFTGYLGYLRITAAARTRDSFVGDTSVTPE